jgi:hypothetical protein
MRGWLPTVGESGPQRGRRGVGAGCGLIPRGAEAEILEDHDLGEIRAGGARLDEGDGGGDRVGGEVEIGALREPAEDLRELAVGAGRE